MKKMRNFSNIHLQSIRLQMAPYSMTPVFCNQISQSQLCIAVWCQNIQNLYKVEKINNFFKFNILLKKRVSMTKIKIKNLIRKKDLVMGLFINDQFWLGVCLTSSLKNTTLWNWIVVDIKKYKKKAIKSQHELLNLKVSCFRWITKRETAINKKVFKFIAKFPTINHRGNE